MERDFYYVLYMTLLAMCPYDTGNMKTNILLTEYDDKWVISISGPKITLKGFYDYARDVNYNPQRTPKEAKNYMWVERAIKQAIEVVGGNVQYELS